MNRSFVVALLVLAAQLASFACTHDWEAYDVQEVEAVELTASQLESCQQYCRAYENCETPIASCDAECARRIVDCGDDGPAERVGDCAQAYQPLTGCSEQLLTACLLEEAPCF